MIQLWSLISMGEQWKTPPFWYSKNIPPCPLELKFTPPLWNRFVAFFVKNINIMKISNIYLSNVQSVLSEYLWNSQECKWSLIWNQQIIMVWYIECFGYWNNLWLWTNPCAFYREHARGFLCFLTPFCHLTSVRYLHVHFSSEFSSTCLLLSTHNM